MAARGKLLVLKFGGTSMGSREAIHRVVAIVRESNRRVPVVTVVSAMAGVTDRLLELGHAALDSRNHKRVESGLGSLRELHEAAFLAHSDSTGQKAWVRRFIDREFEDIQGILRGIRLLQEFSQRTHDTLLSHGETLSSRLLARILSIADGAFCHSDARKWLVADPTPHGPVVDLAQTEKLARKHLVSLLSRGGRPIIPGFICRTSAGVPATLGRNGSDYSASIVGAALRAHEIWIYTDVDGIMTADPNLVAEATILRHITFQEAAEMTFFGAKVLHPKTMIPAVLHRIPIRIKNTFNPQAPGTLISDARVRGPKVKTVTSIRDLALLNLQGKGMMGVPGISLRLFEVLAREQINIMMISQASSEYSICVVTQEEDVGRALKAIRSEFHLELQRKLIETVTETRDISIVSIIGAGMHGTPGVSGKFFGALGKHRVNVLAIAQGSSELNISAAIPTKDDRHAVQALHTAFGLTQDLHVFVFGCGNIGRTLLQQIQENRTNIARSLQVNLKVLGVSTSRYWRFTHKGLSNAELAALGAGERFETLEECEPRPTTEKIFEMISATFRSDIVIVDATGADLTKAHLLALQRGFHVVTANKRPLTRSLNDYREIQRLKRRKGLQYQYEATFGAGLPLLSTLQDLINTGDAILRIQGCLSGTLGFICSRLDEGTRFSEAVREAMKLGYTEPDPRDDLSGIDVARKALIIGREIGIPLEFKHLELHAMLPARFFKLKSVDEFILKLPDADAAIRNRVEMARAEGQVLRFIADITKTGSTVGLRQVPRDSPIGRLVGPDNILVFQTQRYLKNPMVIQGPGAGAGVTAAGVLSDILKIAKSI